MIIIGLGCGGYYEYTAHQQETAAYQQLRNDQHGTIDTLQSENKKLEDDNEQLTKSAADAKAKIAHLTAQVREARLHGFQIPNLDTAAPPLSLSPPPPSNNLGTITTPDGKTLQNCQLFKVKADGIVVNDSDGITEIAYGLLPPELQKRFGYDPRQAGGLTDAQVQALEEQRNAAAQVPAK